MSGQFAITEKDVPAFEYIYNTLCNVDLSKVDKFQKGDIKFSIEVLGIYLDRLKNKSDSENVSGKLPDM